MILSYYQLFYYNVNAIFYLKITTLSNLQNS